MATAAPTAFVEPKLAPKGIEPDAARLCDDSRARLNALFTPEELVESGWADYLARNGPTKEFRRQLSSVDLLFFFYYYLHPHFPIPLAQLHFDVIEMQIEAAKHPRRCAGSGGRAARFGKTTHGYGLCTVGCLPRNAPLYRLNQRQLALVHRNSWATSRPKLRKISVYSRISAICRAKPGQLT